MSDTQPIDDSLRLIGEGTGIACPQNGQNSRCGDNFTMTDPLPPQTADFVWRVLTPTGKPAYPIVINIKSDVGVFSDPTCFQGVRDGDHTPVQYLSNGHRGFYLADPSGHPGPIEAQREYVITVRVYARIVPGAVTPPKPKPKPPGMSGSDKP